MTFSIAPYDRTLKVVTALSCALLLAIALFTHAPIVVRGLMLLIVALSYAYSPKGYEAGDRSIVVKRLIGNVRIPLDGLREARPAASDDFSGCIRLWGNGGMFGYYGLYRTSRLCKCTWYVTDRSKAVIVVTDAKTVVLSPADVDGFLKAIGAPASAPTLFTANGGSGVGTAIGMVFTVFGLAAVAFTFLYAPGPPTYTLTHDSLTIHDRFFYSVTLKADAVDAGGIRVIDLKQEPDWRPTVRTNGFGSPHYQSGWFRLANGRKVELYRAGGDR